MQNTVLQIGLGSYSVPANFETEILPKLGDYLLETHKAELDEQLAALEQEYVDWEVLRETLAKPENYEPVIDFLREATSSRRELLAHTPGFQRMLDQRAHAGRLAFKFALLPGAEAQLSLRAAPWDACAGAFAADIESLSLFLEREIPHGLASLGAGSPAQIQLLNADRIRPYFHAELYASGSTNRAPRQNSENRLFWWLGSFALLIPVVLASLMMYKVYGWVNETQDAYADLKETIFEQKKQIIEHIEKTITTSDQVINLFDDVQSFISGPDSSEN